MSTPARRKVDEAKEARGSIAILIKKYPLHSGTTADCSPGRLSMWHRSVARQLFHHCGGMQAVRWLRRKGVTILTYHKFPADMQLLVGQCEYLRKHYKVISLTRLAQLLRNGDPLPSSAVVITVDDGHRDFYQYAYPVFSKFGFPVTVNLTTGPIDNRGWLWFDIVTYAFLASRRKEIAFPEFAFGRSGGQPIATQSFPRAVVLGNPEQRLALAEQYLDRVKSVPHHDLPLCLTQMQRALEVHVPEEPPERWAMLTWREVKRMAHDGVEFGAHTVNHPVLTQIEEETIYEEIVGAKDRIQTELGKDVLHFAYPNGQPQDLSSTIVKMVSDAGFQTSVTTIPRQVFQGDDPLLLRRISCEAEMPLYRFQMNAAAFRV